MRKLLNYYKSWNVTQFSKTQHRSGSYECNEKTGGSSQCASCLQTQGFHRQYLHASFRIQRPIFQLGEMGKRAFSKQQQQRIRLLCCLNSVPSFCAQPLLHYDCMSPYCSFAHLLLLNNNNPTLYQYNNTGSNPHQSLKTDTLST